MARIAGWYINTTSAAGYVRAADGTITTFSEPGTTDGPFPYSINNAGDSAGDFFGAKGILHGFLRAAGGRIVNFEAPDAGKAKGIQGGTLATSINAAGIVAGYYTDAKGVYHGFLRIP